MIVLIINWNEILINGLAVGLFSGLITSVVFLAILYFIKPNIAISPKIAKVRNPASEQNANQKYMIKIMNRSKHFKAIEVRAELTASRKFVVEGGHNTQLKIITLTIDSMNYLPAFEGRSKEAGYAYLFTTETELEDFWNENTSIRFEIVAKHELTGFHKVFTQDYYTKHANLQIGTFKFGNTFDIV